ncbi:endonuclease/exonuclease/phosphatase family protein [Streptacidiphilus griseoplanus]|uniref:endonuclease/exonuclease/phosphatase family protein n=1 Tax=Peterkaempfera griseoplana TaxID=66896 RepID=UPI0006E411D7|nr:endonuclease/exonuclease/phosphatase family protein [Peterkaempfera griseoplana]
MSQLRIATFNLLHGQPLAPDGTPLPFPPRPADPTAAAALLAEAVAALDADVLALQEVDRCQPRSGLVDQAAVAARAMGASDWRFAAALHGRPAPVSGWVRDASAVDFRVYGPAGADGALDAPSYGTALLTRLPVRHWRARRFPPAPFGLPLRVAGRRGLTQVPDEPRAALAAVLEGDRGPFTAVAAHLSFVPGWNVAQLAAIRRWIADLPRPYLLLGDFNLVGAVPRTVLGGAAVVEGVTRAPRRGRRRTARVDVPALGAVAALGPEPALPAGPGPADGPAGESAGTTRVRSSRRRLRDLREARRTRLERTGRDRPRIRRSPRRLGRQGLQGWRDLARTPTYPSHRPAVQFDHVLAVGLRPAAVGAALTPRTPISDHRPLLVHVDL